MSEEQKPKIPENKQVLADAAATMDKVTVMSAEQSTENYIETYHAISEWIRFADAKAAVILTVGGAMASFFVPTVRDVIQETVGEKHADPHLFPYWGMICIAIFTLYILFFLLSGIWAFLCINPIQLRGRHPSLGYCTHFHPAAVAAEYSSSDVKRFVDDCNQLDSNALRNEVQAAILIDSHVSNKKYGRVKTSLFHFATSVVLGFTYYLLTQL